MEKKFIITPAIQKNLDQMEKRKRFNQRLEKAGNVVKVAFLVTGLLLVARAVRS